MERIPENKRKVIESHRKMWQWIAKTYMNGSHLSPHDLKSLYYKLNNIPETTPHCFCCDYSGGNCDKCPLVWSPYPCALFFELHDIYYDMNARNNYDCVKLATMSMSIANLPERINA